MDGKEYIDSIRTGPMTFPDYAAIRNAAELYRASQESLSGKVRLLHGMGEVALLGTDPPPNIVLIAEADRAAEAVFDKASEDQWVADLVKMLPGGNLAPAQSGIARFMEADTENGMTLDQLVDHVSSLRDTRSDQMVAYSNCVLDGAVQQVHQLGLRKAITDKAVGKVVKNAICNERYTFNLFMRPYPGLLTVERDSTIVVARGGKEVDMRVSVKDNDRPIPSWLTKTKEWDKPLRLTCSLYTETEALIALQEWIVERQLPYLPIVAPRRYEQGDLVGSFSPNTHANILLCCLVPDRNEIIPIQVKNNVLSSSRERYHPGVVLIGTDELGMQSFGTCIVQDGSRKKLGHRSTVTYGNILKYYLMVHGKKGQKHRATPPKESRQAYAALLEPAFDFFDREVLPRMAQPTASATASKRR